MVLDTPIPKIIHQLWIGNKPAPTKFMDTWRDAHEPLGFKYMFWNEKNISQNIDLAPVLQKLNSIEEINGKADVIRWLILQKFGGIFIDADSICIHPFDEHLLNGIDAFGLNTDRARFIRLFFQPVFVVWALLGTGFFEAWRNYKNPPKLS